MNRHRTPLPVARANADDPLPSIGERVVVHLVLVVLVLVWVAIVLSLVG